MPSVNTISNVKADSHVEEWHLGATFERIE